MNTSNIKDTIVKSDILKIFVLLFSFFTLLGVIRLYYQFNGMTIQDLITNYYPYITISNNWQHNLMRPWVFITHLGAELSVMGMLSNFLWLYLFGSIIEDLKGNNSVWPLFLIGAVAAAIMVCICVAINSNTLRSGFYYGMRAGMLAVVVAACVYRPQYKVFQMFNGGFSVWILGLIFLALSLSQGSLDIANFAALAVAALVGYLYNNVLSDNFYRMQLYLNNRAVAKKEFEAKPSRKPKYNPTFYVSGGSKVVDISEAKMDSLLDKISAKGYDSLSEQEKKWLKDYSNNRD